MSVECKSIIAYGFVIDWKATEDNYNKYENLNIQFGENSEFIVIQFGDMTNEGCKYFVAVKNTIIDIYDDNNGGWSGYIMELNMLEYELKNSIKYKSKLIELRMKYELPISNCNYGLDILYSTYILNTVS